MRGGIPKLALDRLISFFAPPDRHRYLGAGCEQNRSQGRPINVRERLNPKSARRRNELPGSTPWPFPHFQDPDLAARFMMRPHPELDDRAPFDAALTEIGGREVEEVIERGLHGLPA